MKEIPQDHLSVRQIVTLSGVCRTTVGDWIRDGRLKAIRLGKNYIVPTENLIDFLKSVGRRVPKELQNDTGAVIDYCYIESCFEYLAGTTHSEACSDCVVFKKNGPAPCFTVRDATPTGCNVPCSRCKFYKMAFLPRLRIVEQIALPAAIFKGLNIWTGNQRFADLCGLTVGALIGGGIEKLVHEDSLTETVAEIKRLDAEGLTASRIFETKLKRNDGSVDVKVSMYPLTEPAGTFLMTL